VRVAALPCGLRVAVAFVLSSPCGCAGACGSADPAGEDIAGTDSEGGLPLSEPCLSDATCAPPAQCTSLGGDGKLCLVACDMPADCPEGMGCSYDDGWCAWKTGMVGEACDVENPCHVGLECREVGAAGFCTRACDWNLPCPPAENARCVKLAQGGNYCLRNCGEDEDCAPGLACTPLSEWSEIHVCFP